MSDRNLAVTYTMEQANVCSDMVEFHTQKANTAHAQAKSARLQRDKAAYTVEARVHEQMADFWRRTKVV